MIGGSDQIEHAVNHQGRRLKTVGDAGVQHMDQLKLVKRLAVDACQWREALIVIGAAMQTPIVQVRRGAGQNAIVSGETGGGLRHSGAEKKRKAGKQKGPKPCHNSVPLVPPRRRLSKKHLGRASGRPTHRPACCASVCKKSVQICWWRAPRLACVMRPSMASAAV